MAKHILTISGSSRPSSSNVRLLKSIPLLFPQHQFQYDETISHLPLFRADLDSYPFPEKVVTWREIVKNADAMIISTPEYIHNMPAVVKNALEWLTSSGELMDKRVLPITFTPHEPRGEKAMQSLIWSLTALKARVVTQLPIYQTEITFINNQIVASEEMKEMLIEAIHLLVD